MESMIVRPPALSLDPSSPELTSFAAGYERPSSVRKALEIASAAKLDAGVFPEQKPIDFSKDIQLILERSCLQCHSGNRAKSKYSLTFRDSVLATGNQGSPSVISGHAKDSRLLRVVSDQIEDLEMPPLGKRDKFPALTQEEIVRLAAWIDQELPWPEGVVLQP